MKIVVRCAFRGIRLVILDLRKGGAYSLDRARAPFPFPTFGDPYPPLMDLLFPSVIMHSTILI